MHLRSLRRAGVQRWCAPALLALALGACSTVTTVDRQGPAYTAKPSACAVEVVDGRNRPASSYEALAKIESHIQRNIFFGGKVTLLEDAYKELRSKACQLGGDLVVVEDSLESGAAEYSDVHVWATVFRAPRR